MIFFKKKKIKEEETSESSLDAPEILPEALTDDPDEVDTPVEQSPADDTASDFPVPDVTEPLVITEESPVIPAVNGEESVSPQADENIASAEET